MTMTPGVRKLALIAHVVCSVGWLGSVAAFLALAIAGLNVQDPLRVRGAYLAMETIGWWVIVPLSFASFLTGIVQGLGTQWGLFRHYWVVAKLLINLLATALLLIHMQPTSSVAALAAERALTHDDLRGTRVQLIGDATAAIVVLVVATVLSVYKPKGRTPFGQSNDETGGPRGTSTARPSTPIWVYVAASVVAALVFLFTVSHLLGGGFHHRPH